MTDRKWCAIDAEGDVGGQGLQGVAFYADDFQGYLTDHGKIREVLKTMGSRGYTFVAHNASYDIPVIFWQLGIPMKIVYYNGRINRGEWRYKSGKPYAQCWDSLGLSGGVSLAVLGVSIGLPKYPAPQRLRGIDPDRFEWQCELHGTWECEPCYAIRDAEIVYRFMEGLTTLLTGWGIAPSRRISGISMDVWKMLDRPAPIKIEDGRIERLARDALAGGRVETFKLGHIQPCFGADVASMYPAVMLHTAYPDPTKLSYVEDIAPQHLNWDAEGVADVDISVPMMYLPPLPHRYKGERMFPVGRLRGAWTILELRNAISLGCRVNHVHRAAITTAVLHPFVQCISTLWELREAYPDKDDPRRLFAKLLMNNLYGRLGMKRGIERRDVYEWLGEHDSGSLNGKEWSETAGRIFVEEEKTQYFANKWANVMWAAQTTAAARVKLYGYLQMQGDSIVYCDTDSVFSTRPIVGLGVGLGALTDQEEYDWMYVAQPKLYAYKRLAANMPPSWSAEKCKPHGKVCCDACREQAKAKGVPRRLALQFIREGVVRYDQPIRPSEQGRRHTPAGTWVAVVKERHLVPHRRQPLSPAALHSEFGWSDTQATVVGPLPSGAFGSR